MAGKGKWKTGEMDVDALRERARTLGGDRVRDGNRTGVVVAGVEGGLGGANVRAGGTGRGGARFGLRIFRRGITLMMVGTEMMVGLLSHTGRKMILGKSTSNGRHCMWRPVELAPFVSVSHFSLETHTADNTSVAAIVPVQLCLDQSITHRWVSLAKATHQLEDARKLHFLGRDYIYQKLEGYSSKDDKPIISTFMALVSDNYLTKKRTVRIDRVTLVLTTGRGLSSIHILRTHPLGQPQNLKGPVKSTQLKIGAVVPTPSEQNHLHSTEEGCKASPCHADHDPDANVFLDDGMDVDTEFTPCSVIQKQEGTVHAVITHLKANAEIQAATQAQQERNLSPLGLTDGGGDLSDVPKMDSPESDESGLEFELDTIVKGLDARLSSSTSAHTSTSNEVNTRQSTRHLPNRDVKVKLFRDDSPGPSTPRTTFKPKPKSNVACPLDRLLKAIAAKKPARAVSKKRDTKAD
ncbi:hypothetical protein BU17DRAFT_68352 [Hysterangium stoloniferum]|nr:hypothetical protein BU17DRAFT_68352 [Hysterangium stoloniferum]